MLDLTALNTCYKYFPCFAYDVLQHQGVIYAINGSLDIDSVEVSIPDRD
jgi:hypothetical protein